MRKQETVLQEKIVKELSKHGEVIRLHVGKYRTLDGKRIVSIGKKGTSDLAFMKKGETSFIEVKLNNGELSSEQVDFLHRMTRLGFRAGVARSVEDACRIAGIPYNEVLDYV